MVLALPPAAIPTPRRPGLPQPGLPQDDPADVGPRVARAGEVEDCGGAGGARHAEREPAARRQRQLIAAGEQLADAWPAVDEDGAGGAEEVVFLDALDRGDVRSRVGH